jgi:flagellar basal body-associated protein FliL
LVQLEDIIITTSSVKTRVELLTDKGKEELRREMLNKFNEVLNKPISNIFYTQFLVE